MLDTKKIIKIRKEYTSFLSSLRKLRSEVDKELSETIAQIKDDLKKLKTEAKITQADIYYLYTPHLLISSLDVLKHIIYQTRVKEIKKKLGCSNYKAGSNLAYLRRWVEWMEYKNEEKIKTHKKLIEKIKLKSMRCKHD